MFCLKPPPYSSVDTNKLLCSTCTDWLIGQTCFRAMQICFPMNYLITPLNGWCSTMPNRKVSSIRLVEYLLCLAELSKTCFPTIKPCSLVNKQLTLNVVQFITTQTASAMSIRNAQARLLFPEACFLATSELPDPSNQSKVEFICSAIFISEWMRNPWKANGQSLRNGSLNQ